MRRKRLVESVYVVPRERLFDGKPIPQGFRTHGLKQLIQRIYGYGKFIKRNLVEYNPSLKQIIPYALVSFNPRINQTPQPYRNNSRCRHRDSLRSRDGVYPSKTAAPQFLLLRRKGTQTEKRLHHKYSLGVGGHINPIEQAPSKARNQGKIIIESGLKRELAEELVITCDYTAKAVGYLNDDTNPVGQVHFGLVYQIEVTTKNGVGVAEKDLMSGRFLTVEQIRKYYPLMETWSQIIYNRLFLKKR